MKLILRGDFWYYRFEIGGHEYFHTTKCRKGDKAEAKLVAAQVYKETVLGHNRIRRAPSLKGIASAWTASHGRRKSKGHQRAARQCLDALKSLHKTPIDQISNGVIGAWAVKYLETHSQASLNMVFRYLKLWLRWALREKYLSEMPCDLKQDKPPERKRPIVDLENLDDFTTACAGQRNPQISVGIDFAEKLGMREAEILRASWQDLGAQAITIYGKGGKIRMVHIPDVVWADIGWYLLRSLGGKEGKYDPGGPIPMPRLGLIFPARDGKQHRQGWLRQALKRGAAALKVPVIGIHRLRASFATLHLRAKAPLKDVQEMMGHADPRTTLIYQETSLEEQAKHQNALWKTS